MDNIKTSDLRKGNLIQTEYGILPVGNSYFYMNTDIESLPGEDWIDILGFDGLYQISNMGRIKSMPRELHTPTGCSYFTKEKILRQTKNKSSSNRSINLYITICRDGRQFTNTVLQYIGMSFIRPINNGECYYHKNKDTLDNRLENIGITKHSESHHIDFIHKKRTAHNFKFFEKFTKPKYKITREDGVILTYSQICELYGEAAYANILRGYNVRKIKWTVEKLNSVVSSQTKTPT